MSVFQTVKFKLFKNYFSHFFLLISPISRFKVIRKQKHWGRADNDEEKSDGYNEVVRERVVKFCFFQSPKPIYSRTSFLQYSMSSNMIPRIVRGII